MESIKDLKKKIKEWILDETYEDIERPSQPGGGYLINEKGVEMAADEIASYVYAQITLEKLKLINSIMESIPDARMQLARKGGENHRR